MAEPHPGAGWLYCWPRVAQVSRSSSCTAFATLPIQGVQGRGAWASSQPRLMGAGGYCLWALLPKCLSTTCGGPACVPLPLTLEPAMRAMPMDSLRFIPPLRNLHRASRLSSRLRMCSICLTSSGHLWRDKPFSCSSRGQRQVAGACDTRPASHLALALSHPITGGPPSPHFPPASPTPAAREGF